jgi:murein DD-endopeptidase MepM/ murein hydrolase activator NlpD
MRKLVTLLLAFAGIWTLAWTAADVPAPHVAHAPDTIAIPVAGIHASDLRDNFDDARAGHMHRALDIMAPRGTAVLAAVDGKVRKLFTSRAGGLTLYQTDPLEETIYYYAHLERYADGIREGMALHKGDVIAYVGTSGNAPPKRPHLHFAIQRLPATKEWWKGEAVNPYPILMEHGVTIQPERFEVQGSN